MLLGSIAEAVHKLFQEKMKYASLHKTALAQLLQFSSITCGDADHADYAQLVDIEFWHVRDTYTDIDTCTHMSSVYNF